MLQSPTVEETKYTIDEAFSYCEKLTNKHYENFPVASLFLPAEKRPYLQAVYAFSRIADDFADEFNLSSEDRLVRLHDWGEELKECYEGNAEHPVFLALGETIKRYEIPITLFQDLLDAFQRDVKQKRYETFDDLLSYCRCSANPVGRIVLIIFGYRDEKLYALSDYICTALQLTNFWQDIAIDMEKDRLYVPLNDMARCSYTINDWQGRVVNSNFREFMQFQISRTRELFYKGAELPSLVNKELQLELKLVWFGGMAILKMIEKNSYDVFTKRPNLKNRHKALVLLRGILYDNLTQFGKSSRIWDLT